MVKSDFYYDLPPELIAQTPVEPRDSARMLFYNKSTDEIKDLHFFDIEKILQKGDVLVINNTRVINARIYAYNDSGKKFEVLLLKRIDLSHWEALLRPARKAKIGTTLTVNSELKLTIDGINSVDGVRTIKFEYEGILEDILDRAGEVPLPPYITAKLEDNERYQTVYNKIKGSSAAPTAGLHFTNELIERLKAKGIEFVEVLLHVGLGTFRPVKEENILDHKMHSEYYEVSKESAEKINNAIEQGRRIIAVGTTSVRVLESAADCDGKVKATNGETDIFIYPGYEFKIVKGLITNFHLPESTLIMLVSAFLSREKVLEIYKHAVEEKYRFFSFGDATLIL